MSTDDDPRPPAAAYLSHFDPNRYEYVSGQLIMDCADGPPVVIQTHEPYWVKRKGVGPLIIPCADSPLMGERKNQSDEPFEAVIPPAEPPKQKQTQAQIDAMVVNWFRQHKHDKPEHITRDRIAAEIKVSGGSVSKSPMWIAFAKKKKAARTPTERAVPFTDTMHATIPAEADMPEELAALIEEQEAEEAEELRRHSPS